MNKETLIGQRVMNRTTLAQGTIVEIDGSHMRVDFYGDIITYSFPSCFDTQLELEDEDVMEELKGSALDAKFDRFKNTYIRALRAEISHLKQTGGTRYHVVDGELIDGKRDDFIYTFEADFEAVFPDGTSIKIYFQDRVISAEILYCEEFTITIRVSEYLGEKVDLIEFAAEQWKLIEKLIDQIEALNPQDGSIAYSVACHGKSQINQRIRIRKGHKSALNMAVNEPITFIWGPPGTGKTETLAEIAIESINKGNRVLLLSYSNVSVDGGLLRVVKKADFFPGMVIRYGYPKTAEILNSDYLSSYRYVLNNNPDLKLEYSTLIEERNKLGRKDPNRIAINKRLAKIRESLSQKEKELIQNSAFIATTVSKAIVDSAVYGQQFDVVIFDEASMAYVPQIVFSAGLAKKHFICIGDFRQLPAIASYDPDEVLSNDIFSYVGITNAVENGYGHNWLIMLNTQYRMHHQIADFVSENMYMGLLETAESIYRERAGIAKCSPVPDEAVSIIDLSHMYSVCSKLMDNSRINIMSALISIYLAMEYVDKYDVGIITPYRAQSRLILQMVRDLTERDPKYGRITSATVHQFQGSERDLIIYDTVDCYRMTYPGVLLTAVKNDTANRLFNVAMTRARGKFIVVANVDYLKRKKLSKNLLFRKLLDGFLKNSLREEEVYDILEKDDELSSLCDRFDNFDSYISDISMSKKSIRIDLPDIICEDEGAVISLVEALKQKRKDNVSIKIRCDSDLILPEELSEFIEPSEYITNPVTIIDEKIIWFGQPLYAAEFISEGDVIETRTFPSIRFEGRFTGRILKEYLQMR